MAPRIPFEREVSMLHFATPPVGWLQELLLIVTGMLLLFAFGAMVMAPWRRGREMGQSAETPAGLAFDPHKNGRGTFYPWIPVA